MQRGLQAAAPAGAAAHGAGAPRKWPRPRLPPHRAAADLLRQRGPALLHQEEAADGLQGQGAGAAVGRRARLKAAGAGGRDGPHPAMLAVACPAHRHREAQQAVREAPERARQPRPTTLALAARSLAWPARQQARPPFHHVLPIGRSLFRLAQAPAAAAPNFAPRPPHAVRKAVIEALQDAHGGSGSPAWPQAQKGAPEGWLRDPRAWVRNTLWPLQQVADDASRLCR